MKTSRITRSQFINQPVEKVFEFFNTPENLGKLTPPEMSWRILTPKPLRMSVGKIFDYSIRLFGVPMTWKSIITDFDPPYSFVDEQLTGPYRFWHHSHVFEKANGGTLVKDEVHYLVPLGIFGRILEVLFIKRQLKRIFDFRREALKKHFSSIQSFGNTNAK
jgi:hypothetical protein